MTEALEPAGWTIYGTRCECPCHHTPGIRHFMACCSSEKRDTPMTKSIRGESVCVSTTDYPVASPQDIAPPIYRAMIICSMALQYLRAIAPSSVDFSLDEAFDAAHATWDTEWPDDPEPRTIEASRDVVSDDLAYWAEG